MKNEVSEDDYRSHLNFCKRFDTWILKTACCLVTGGLPDYAKRDHPAPGAFHKIYEAAISCAGQSLPLIDDHVPVEEYRVSPSTFIHWVMSNEDEFEVYPLFREVTKDSSKNSKWEEVNDIMELNKLFEEETGRRLPVKISAKLRDYDERRKSQWRCRGLAAYFWSLDPSLSKVGMAKRPELTKFGCNNKRYNTRQMGDWIDDLNPNKRPAKPKKIRKRPKPITNYML